MIKVDNEHEPSTIPPSICESATIDKFSRQGPVTNDYATHRAAIATAQRNRIGIRQKEISDGTLWKEKGERIEMCQISRTVTQQSAIWVVTLSGCVHARGGKERASEGEGERQRKKRNDARPPETQERKKQFHTGCQRRPIKKKKATSAARVPICSPFAAALRPRRAVRHYAPRSGRVRCFLLCVCAQRSLITQAGRQSKITVISSFALAMTIHAFLSFVGPSIIDIIQEVNMYGSLESLIYK